MKPHSEEMSSSRDPQTQLSRATLPVPTGPSQQEVIAAVAAYAITLRSTTLSPEAKRPSPPNTMPPRTDGPEPSTTLWANRVRCALG